MYKWMSIAAALLIAASAPASAQTNSYGDSDWNGVLIDSCGLPRATSVAQVRVAGDSKLRVTLMAGDKGKCSTDNKARHRAPYWERAELTQTTRMPLGTRHRISAEVTIEQGFTGDRETFMQVHGWAQDCQHAYPPVMMKFKNGRLAVEVLRGASAFRSGGHRNVLRGRVDVSSLYGRPVVVALDFDTRTKPGLLSVSLDGVKVVSDAKVSFADCAQPYLKLGIYRPGGGDGGTSVAVFDDVRVQRND